MLTIYKLLAAVVIFFVGLITALYPLKKQAKQGHSHSVEFAEAFASGIFLGVAFIHMLPHAIGEFSALYPGIDFPVAELICVSGFVLMMFLERLSTTTQRFKTSSAMMPYILAAILFIHAFTEGAALGLGGSFAETFMLFIAVIAHKGSESFAFCVALIRYHLTHARILLLIGIFALMSPFGIGLGTTVSLISHSHFGKLAVIIFNAFAAGTFFYISTLHHVYFHQRNECSTGLQEFFYLLLGLVIMSVIGVFT
jgi:zinc transporter ZupT